MVKKEMAVATYIHMDEKAMMKEVMETCKHMEEV